jgi:hypothetical protein
MSGQTEADWNARAKELVGIFDVEGVPNHSGCVSSTPNTMKNEPVTEILAQSMMPLARPSSPWKAGSAVVKDAEGDLQPYEPKADLPTRWVELGPQSMVGPTLLDTVNAACVSAKAAKAALDTAKNELELQLETVMARLIKPGMTIQRKQRGSPIWLARVRTMRGNDRGTNTFLIVTAPKVKANPGNPEMSTWSVEATPISEVTGKHMKGSAHGANASHDTVLLVGDMYLDLAIDDVDQTTTSFLKVVAAAEKESI